MSDRVGDQLVELFRLDHAPGDQRRDALDRGKENEATAAHPGYASTNLQFHTDRRWMDLIAGPGGFMEQCRAPKLVERSSAAKDADVARRLWEVSEG